MKKPGQPEEKIEFSSLMYEIKVLPLNYPSLRKKFIESKLYQILKLNRKTIENNKNKKNIKYI